MTAPKPTSREGRVSLWRYARLFRQDILSAQPERLYGAWMAEFRTPFFRSFLVNQPELVREVLQNRPRDFPKSNRVTEGLRPLLGNAVFVTNGTTWERQRRIIDPAFEAARISRTLPAMRGATEAALVRLRSERTDIEAWASHVTADVIFRTLFSVPIEDLHAHAVYKAFQRFQRAQPILNLGAFLRLPRWVPRLHRRETRMAAREIRDLIAQMVDARAAAIAAGRAPDDLATKIMTTPDPVTGKRFSPAEMIDQVAIFFLAGHETSAAAISWALYLLAANSEAQERVAEEGQTYLRAGEDARLSDLVFTRDVFRETLRLYPPVPMMVREAACAERFRDRSVPEGAQIVLSPWHLQRHTRIWERPDIFDPDRWRRDKACPALRTAYIPFSAGPRVCPGAGFAMAEGPLVLAMSVGTFQFALPPDPPPIPVAHLTVRSKNGIHLELSARFRDENAT